MANFLAALVLAGGMVASVWVYGNMPPARWHAFRVSDAMVGAVEDTTGEVVVCSEGAGCVRLGSASMPTASKANRL